MSEQDRSWRRLGMRQPSEPRADDPAVITVPRPEPVVSAVWQATAIVLGVISWFTRSTLEAVIVAIMITWCVFAAVSALRPRGWFPLVALPLLVGAGFLIPALATSPR